ncbi:hypothetical protein [Acetobacter oeni]|uniref:Uncharacterized protein n=1 Tax=Acetobacter oeni TaxID=304077 RepID=A0A511XJW8_9PROT|nr:hypothetical protein [Acetobacter oeni]MBB3883464.1 hypothetical protein [Acetobacter oeni]NHO19434.1 hypothetical protein [Acetobacter oeni]GBR04073.1 hypothetical protein AA21952_1293 [Acetobacter oeni LMG 21952]GEN63245.1 hypothetical protein AOE01nite_14690 [Acetobacter oeni]
MSPVLPEWLPLWAQLLLIVATALFGVCFLLMPFAVFGLKGRLSEIELQLADVRADLRVITARLASASPEPAEQREPFAAAQEEWVPPAKKEQTSAEPRFQSAKSDQAIASPGLNAESGTFFPPSGGKTEATSETRPAHRNEPDENSPVGEAPRSAAEGTAARVTYGFSSAPRVSDAYQPEKNILPELRASRHAPPVRINEKKPDGNHDGPGRRMPWHESPSSESDRKGPAAGERDNAMRTEPTLRWPSRRPE